LIKNGTTFHLIIAHSLHRLSTNHNTNYTRTIVGDGAKTIFLSSIGFEKTGETMIDLGGGLVLNR
jgi:hypothetical protein